MPIVVNHDIFLEKAHDHLLNFKMSVLWVFLLFSVYAHSTQGQLPRG